MNREKILKVVENNFANLLFFIGLLFLNSLGFQNGLIFHLIAEIYTIIISCCIFVIIWVIREKIDSSFYSILGIGLLFTAFFDLMHAVTYEGMNILPQISLNQSIQSWNSARLLQSITFLIAPLYIGKRTNFSLWISISLFTTIGLSFVILSDVVPNLVAYNENLSISINLFEILIISFFALSIIHIYLKRKSFNHKILGLIFLSILLSLISEIIIATNISGDHMISIAGLNMKVLSYFFLFQIIMVEGISQPQEVFYRGLKTNWEQLNSLINNLNEGIAIINLKDRFVFTNRAADHIFGLNTGKLKSSNLMDFLSKNQQSIYLQQKNIQSRNKAGSYELEITRPDRAKRTLMVTASPHYFENDFSGFSVVFQDFTDRKADELKLKDSEEKFRLLTENAGVGIGFIDLQGRVIFINNKALGYIGGELENYISKSISEILGGEWGERIYARILESSNTDEILSYEDVISLPIGKKWFTSYYNRILDKNKKCTGVQIVTNDITDRKQLEGELKSLAKFPEENPNPVLRISRDGLVSYSNKSGQKILKTWKCGVNQQIPQDIQKRINACLINKSAQTFEIQLDHEVISLVITPIVEMGYVNIYGRDVTELKNAEAELKKYSRGLEKTVAEKTEQLTQAQEQLVRQEKLAFMGQLASGVGHELRNPLAVINNALFVLKSTIKDKDENTREYLKMIDQEVGTADKIISDLLNFARIKTAEQEPTNLHSLINKILERFYPPENVQVEVKLAQNLPPVYVDHKQIEEVLINLISNAYEAMPKGGRILINGKSMDNQVCISIKDSGIGISKENMERIFEPLFTTKVKGIGLGLTVTKMLTEANHGRIIVKSTVGKGTTFTLFLPKYLQNE